MLVMVIYLDKWYSDTQYGRVVLTGDYLPYLAYFACSIRVLSTLVAKRDESGAWSSLRPLFAPDAAIMRFNPYNVPAVTPCCNVFSMAMYVDSDSVRGSGLFSFDLSQPWDSNPLPYEILFPGEMLDSFFGPYRSAADERTAFIATSGGRNNENRNVYFLYFTVFREPPQARRFNLRLRHGSSVA